MAKAHEGKTVLEQSIEKVLGVLSQPTETLSREDIFETLANELAKRRTLDLSDLSPEEQFERIVSRVSHIITPERLKELLSRGTPIRVKFGIDPTGADVHLGHAVPMILAGRLQRMGHALTIIVGDVTAKIGDPSGRTKERPALTDDDIARNLATYQEQMAPFFDLEKAELRKNSDWLLAITTPELLALLGRIPLSMQLQREDFRKRLEAGHSLSTAELLYSIYMAYDSVAVEADVEIGGVDQLLNMQMCRKVMEVRDLVPEVILTTDLIEGTDGTGDKMSKSKGNYIGLNEAPEEIYGKVMSIPDRLIVPYLRTVTEIADVELAAIEQRMRGGSLNPMTAKHLLAYDTVTVLKGNDAARRAREHFSSQFSKRSFSDLVDIPIVSLEEHGATTLVELLVKIGFAESKSEARRLAEGGGIQLVSEGGAGGVKKCTPDEAGKELLSTLIETFRHDTPGGTAYFLKVGRSVARLH